MCIVLLLISLVDLTLFPCALYSEWQNKYSLLPPSLPLPLSDDGDAIQDYLKTVTGARTVPRVFIGGKCIGGGSETRDLHQQGKLVPLLQSAGAL